MRLGRSFKRETLLTLALLAGSIACSLVLAELILRATLYRNVDYERSKGPHSSYRHTTTEFDVAVRTNSLDMRDDEWGEKRDGERRVFCIGDSFTFGVGVELEQTWVKVAERLLRESGSSRIRFINAGGKGAEAASAYRYLGEQAAAFEPDAVVLQVFIGNDFYDLLRHEQLPGAEARAAAARGRGRSLRSRLARNVRLIDFLWNRIIGLEWADRWLFRYDLRYGHQGIFLEEYPELETRLVELEIDYLGRIARLCRERNIALFVLVIPAKPQVFQADFMGPRYDARKPNRLLAEFLRAEEVPFLDLLDEFEGLPRSQLRSFYYVRDLHFTPEGHAFAARRLTRALLLPWSQERRASPDPRAS